MSNLKNQLESFTGVEFPMDKELEQFRALKAQEYKAKKQKDGKFGFLKVPEWIKTTLDRILTLDINLDTWILLLKIIFWLILWKIFILLEFGTVFFVLSMFYWVYNSMKEGTRKPWEPSAYSVFNKDFETIDGTFTAEQFEKELKFGAGAVKKD